MIVNGTSPSDFLEPEPSIHPLARASIQSLPSTEYASHDAEERIEADLSLNINPAGAPQGVRAALADALTSTHRYPFINKELVAAISARADCHPDQVLLGDGADGCLRLISLAFLDKGDAVMIPIPTFHRYELHARMMGADVRFHRMTDFRLDATALLEDLREAGSKLLFLCTPNNPTGVPVDESTIREVCQGFKGLVVIDEALADVSDVDNSHLVATFENLMVVRSFSKAFGLASLRIGYVIGSASAIAALRKVTSPFQVSGPAQAAALTAIQDADFIKSSRDFVDGERKRMTESLDSLGLSCSESVTTNLVIDTSPMKLTGTQCVEALMRQGVRVTAPEAFRLPHERFIRVSVATKDENDLFLRASSDLAFRKKVENSQSFPVDTKTIAENSSEPSINIPTVDKQQRGRTRDGRNQH
ncbi:MAG: histidinol-phosphate transaminase [Nanoarchaeota archaeon]